MSCKKIFSARRTFLPTSLDRGWILEAKTGVHQVKELCYCAIWLHSWCHAEASKMKSQSVAGLTDGIDEFSGKNFATGQPYPPLTQAKNKTRVDIEIRP